MAVHVPLSFVAQAEAHLLMLSHMNLLAPAIGDPISVLMLMGLYVLTSGNRRGGIYQDGGGNHRTHSVNWAKGKKGYQIEEGDIENRKNECQMKSLTPRSPKKTNENIERGEGKEKSEQTKRALNWKGSAGRVGETREENKLIYRGGNEENKGTGNRGEKHQPISCILGKGSEGMGCEKSPQMRDAGGTALLENEGE
ncbi:hypothetical protein ACH5RR_001263 [Cinchona calisaya]|uniref:Uncharacterized protein n=1 Tax=Cinchona calisaya TaxID=153742 RepID=A0ABD3B437_9GENT